MGGYGYARLVDFCVSHAAGGKKYKKKLNKIYATINKQTTLPIKYNLYIDKYNLYIDKTTNQTKFVK